MNACWTAESWLEEVALSLTFVISVLTEYIEHTDDVNGSEGQPPAAPCGWREPSHQSSGSHPDGACGALPPSAAHDNDAFRFTTGHDRSLGQIPSAPAEYQRLSRLAPP